MGTNAWQNVTGQAARASAAKKSPVLSTLGPSWARPAQQWLSLQPRTGHSSSGFPPETSGCESAAGHYCPAEQPPLVNIPTRCQSPEGLTSQPCRKGRRETSFADERGGGCVNQGSDPKAAASGCLMGCEWFSLGEVTQSSLLVYLTVKAVKFLEKFSFLPHS